jgi:3-deoxy-manno-octulosonate cytidylyltransferase (CMP-KDO synthetase)
MKCLAVIPARHASSRFPGKPLARLGGKPMVQWVYEAAARDRVFGNVVVATDHEGIADTVRRFGGHVEMTRPDHLSGTDRVAEVAERFPGVDVVVNVQGDQPFVTTDMLTRLIAPYRAGEFPDMATVACPFAAPALMENPGAVKVVLDQNGNALYFSRASIPYLREPGRAPVFHHLGLYAFRREFLRQFTALAPTPLEKCEQLEQLRALENGYRIRVSLVEHAIVEVNTPADLASAEAMLARRAELHAA